MREARVVTLAELHGAGGSQIGRQVADRLGVQFLDREILSSVARRAGLSETAVAEAEQEPRRSWDRVLEALGRASPPSGASEQVERLDLQEHELRRQIEQFLSDASRSGAVVLGHGGAIVLASTPRALHAYVGGSREGRIERVISLRGIDRASAAREVTEHDHARRDYVRNVYGIDVNDPALYHLMIDTVSLGIDICVDLIVAASDSLAGRPHAGTSATA